MNSIAARRSRGVFVAQNARSSDSSVSEATDSFVLSILNELRMSSVEFSSLLIGNLDRPAAAYNHATTIGISFTQSAVSTAGHLQSVTK